MLHKTSLSEKFGTFSGKKFVLGSWFRKTVELKVNFTKGYSTTSAFLGVYRNFKSSHIVALTAVRTFHQGSSYLFVYAIILRWRVLFCMLLTVSQWTQDVNWTYLRRSIYVLCLLGYFTIFCRYYCRHDVKVDAVFFLVYFRGIKKTYI